MGKINCYQAMNCNIKNYLKMREDNISLYAAARIGELEKVICDLLTNQKIDLVTSEKRIELLNLVSNRGEIK